jgi:hypothetical protein
VIIGVILIIGVLGVAAYLLLFTGGDTDDPHDPYGHDYYGHDHFGHDHFGHDHDHDHYGPDEDIQDVIDQFDAANVRTLEWYQEIPINAGNLRGDEYVRMAKVLSVWDADMSDFILSDMVTSHAFVQAYGYRQSIPIDGFEGMIHAGDDIAVVLVRETNDVYQIAGIYADDWAGLNVPRTASLDYIVGVNLENFTEDGFYTDGIVLVKWIAESLYAESLLEGNYMMYVQVADFREVVAVSSEFWQSVEVGQVAEFFVFTFGGGVYWIDK